MTAPIEDVSSLPGKKVSDQEQVPIGEVKEIYATDGHPTWVAVEVKSGMADKRTVYIPLARLKDEDGELSVPYSKNHIGESPEIDAGDGISAECDQQLRAYYGIDAGDQELRSDNKGYATVVPDEPGESERVEDVDSLETPDPDKRTDETESRLRDPGSSEMRNVTAEDVASGEDDTGEGDKRQSGGDSDEQDDEEEGAEQEDREQD